MRWIVLFLWSVLAAPALAKTEACLTSIDGEPVALMYDTADGILRENQSYRERLFGRYGRITCPGYVTLRALTPDLTDAERTLFCLQYDRPRRTYTGFVVGERDAYVGCRAESRRFCRHVEAATDTARSIARFGGEVVGGAISASGLAAEQHVSGALVLTGSRGTVAGALGKLGADALAVLSSPAVLTAAAVTVVTVGGAVYVCGE